MDAFASLVTGVVALDLEGARSSTVKNTSLLTTSLLRATELAYLRPSKGGLETLFWPSQDRNQEGLYGQYHDTPSASLIETMEELFRNTTVSLMSDAFLWYVSLRLMLTL